MKRDAGLCRQIWMFSRATSAVGVELLVDERAQHRQEQRHQQRRGAAFAGDVAERQTMIAAIGLRQHVVEVAADRVGGLGEAGNVDVGRRERAARQHRQLNLARDLELALERESIGDLEQHQQVDEDQAQKSANVPSAQTGAAAESAGTACRMGGRPPRILERAESSRGARRRARRSRPRGARRAASE